MHLTIYSFSNLQHVTVPMATIAPKYGCGCVVLYWWYAGDQTRAPGAQHIFVECIHNL